MSPILRVAVVGGGLIAQAVHVPNLVSLSDRFRLVAIADPSARVRAALAARYAPVSTYPDWRDLLEQCELDAVIVCAPHATHADIVMAALDLGLHTFVEKPLCITVEDADAIAERARTTGRVVQVGYMKRYARAYSAFLDALPPATDALKLVDVVTYDPWMAREPFVAWSRIAIADDLPAAAGERIAAAEREQVARAVGVDDPESVRTFSNTFLAALVHDVNLVQGALDRMGIGSAVRVRDAASWASGDAAAITVALAGGAVWRTSWMLLRGLQDFEERATVYFDDAIHELTLPAPYHTTTPVRHRVRGGARGVPEVREQRFVDDPYVAELLHFHDCVTAGAPCLTPPEQARRDIALLRDLYLTCTDLR